MLSVTSHLETALKMTHTDLNRAEECLKRISELPDNIIKDEDFKGIHIDDPDEKKLHNQSSIKTDYGQLAPCIGRAYCPTTQASLQSGEPIVPRHKPPCNRGSLLSQDTSLSESSWAYCPRTQASPCISG